MLFAFRRHSGARSCVLGLLCLGAALASCGGRGPIPSVESSSVAAAGSGGSAATSGTDGRGGFGVGGSSGHAGSWGGSSGACSPPSVECSGTCTLLDFDPANCGACDNACGEGELCSLGNCGLRCSGGTDQCGQRCVDLSIDPLHCGACDRACGLGQVCSGGLCGASCSGALTACDGECVDTELDPRHCGGCDIACDAGQLCTLGMCASSCLGGTTQCGELCVDTNDDPSYCGDCWTACPSGELCSGGECSLTCNGGTTECNGRCVDTDVDPHHCGSCDEECAGDEVCSGGECASVCGGSLKKCGNECVDLKQSIEHCGACDEACSAGQECSDGECLDCDSSVEDCDGDGWFVAEGDCCDNPGGCGSEPTRVNPGALEVTGNGVDDDCNGKIDLFDTEAFTACDGGLESAANSPLDYAKALGICRVTEEHPSSPSQRTWGVIEAKLLRADGSELGDTRARSIRPDFGSISTTQGQAMVVLSTGVAADASDTNPGPNGGAPAGTNVSSSHNPGSAVSIASCTQAYCVSDWFSTPNPPLKNANQLPRAPECGASSSSNAYDSVMLVLRMRAPTNAHSFSFNSYFLSAEYPEYVCSPYNDQFIALVDTPAGEPEPIANPIDKNLLIYTEGGSQWPIGINIAKGTNLFAVCAPQADNPCWNTSVNPASCSLGTAPLVGTGFEAPSGNDAKCTVGGGTHWLTTAGNVVPGSIVELRIVVWDVGDSGFDSTALVDGFQWLPSATLPGTN